MHIYLIILVASLHKSIHIIVVLNASKNDAFNILL